MPRSVEAHRTAPLSGAPSHLFVFLHELTVSAGQFRSLLEGLRDTLPEATFLLPNGLEPFEGARPPMVQHDEHARSEAGEPAPHRARPEHVTAMFTLAVRARPGGCCGAAPFHALPVYLRKGKNMLVETGMARSCRDQSACMEAASALAVRQNER